MWILCLSRPQCFEAIILFMIICKVLPFRQCYSLLVSALLAHTNTNTFDVSRLCRRCRLHQWRSLKKNLSSICFEVRHGLVVIFLRHSVYIQFTPKCKISSTSAMPRVNTMNGMISIGFESMNVKILQNIFRYVCCDVKHHIIHYLKSSESRNSIFFLRSSELLTDNFYSIAAFRAFGLCECKRKRAIRFQII